MSRYLDILPTEELSSDEIDFVENLLDLIPKVLNCYYQGKTFDSFKLFTDFINDFPLFPFRFPKHNYPQGTSFFRIRTKGFLNDHQKFQRSDMFHHAFELRGKVATQRYSIPGFPCLYIGDSLYVCWEELNRPDLRKVQAVRLVNTQAFSVFGIDFSVYGNSRKINTITERNTLINYLLFWPLFAVCSIEVEDNCKGNPFKREYIFPQLLLQSCSIFFENTYNSITMSAISGIQYSSTRVKSNLYKTGENQFFNLVLPPSANDNTKDGHSYFLKSLFQMTEVADIGQLNFGGKTLNIKPQVPKKIELFKGMPSNYKTTELGKIEAYLRAMPTSDISFP